MPETTDDRIKALIDDIKDISLCLTDPREWSRQEAIRELRKDTRDLEAEAEGAAIEIEKGGRV